MASTRSAHTGGRGDRLRRSGLPGGPCGSIEVPGARKPKKSLPRDIPVCCGFFNLQRRTGPGLQPQTGSHHSETLRGGPRHDCYQSTQFHSFKPNRAPTAEEIRRVRAMPLGLARAPSGAVCRILRHVYRLERPCAVGGRAPCVSSLLRNSLSRGTQAM